MPFGGGGSGGRLTIPGTSVSVPPGTTIAVDEFGTLTITGTDGNTGELLLKAVPSAAATRVSSSAGVSSRSGPGIAGIAANLDHANGLSLQDALGNEIAAIDMAGSFRATKNAADIDDFFTAGMFQLWYDKTNGASKLMVKAKQADGTVKTAAIALS